MNLDEKIESIDDIFTPFGSYILAKQFIGKDGYFAQSFEDFHDLSTCRHGTLDCVEEDIDIPCIYRLKESGILFKFFLPSACVQFDKEPKFRPFNMTEFMQKFPFGTTVSFRHKDTTGGYFRVIFIGYTAGDSKEEPDKNVCLGCCWYSFKELAEEFEYRNESGEWYAFGVKEL